MKKEDLGVLAALLLIVAMAVGGCAYYFHAKSECDARGGALIKGAADLPTCLVLNK